ncbi:hypothetical protein RJD24_14515 [Bacillaceae bacterium IKA-2]|nr:hypothetical protein RJD24_14515 [Bacillaceae bacterium IKA-2]
MKALLDNMEDSYNNSFSVIVIMEIIASGYNATIEIVYHAVEDEKN